MAFRTTDITNPANPLGLPAGFPPVKDQQGLSQGDAPQAQAPERPIPRYVDNNGRGEVVYTQEPGKPAQSPGATGIPSAATLTPEVIREANKPNLAAQPEATPAANGTGATTTAPKAEANGQTPQDHVTAQVAKQIGKFAETLGISPDDTTEHARIADDLIVKREFKLKNGLVVSIEMLDEKLDKDPALKAGLEKEFGKGATLESVIPTAEKRDAINAAIKHGEEQNTGFSGLINLLMGFLSWIANRFEGSLSDHIATTTANSVAGDVAKHLTNSGKLSQEEIARVTDNVRTTALEKGGVKVAKQETGTAVETTQPAAAPATQPEQPSTGKEATSAVPATTQAETTTGKETATTAPATPPTQAGAHPSAGKGAQPASADSESPDKEAKNYKSVQIAKSNEKPESSHKAVTKKEKPAAEKGQEKAQAESTAKPEGKTPPEQTDQKKEKSAATADNNKPAGISNLEKTANRMMDSFLNQPDIKSLELKSDDIKNIKSVVIATLKEKRNDPALSKPDYDGNYKLFASDIASAIVDETNISKHKSLIKTPVSDQKNVFAEELQKFLEKGNGAELRKAALTDKAQNITSIEGIDLQKLGVNATGNATTLAMRAQPSSAAGAVIG